MNKRRWIISGVMLIVLMGLSLPKAQAVEEIQEDVLVSLGSDVVLATIQVNAAVLEPADPTEFLIADMESNLQRVEDRVALLEAQNQARLMELAKAENRYAITDGERALLHKAVMAEARGESYEGQMMIAQCILDGARRNNFDIAGAINRYRIATVDATPTESVKNAVSAVFDHGERVTQEKADLWYAYNQVNSSWHEGQQYVTTIGVHRFFWCNKDMG